ncbi:AraC family transcriptional regulator [Streptomyces sp. Act143]|uniref:AraC-like ligand-binding domain-containing protein n=1 Tax=Streptomyces sp. Act143 TaxID=2200760 RepID=UPI000D680E72|nr:helix-turn-helix domain-containing protein [Streptomyces sp. Act143]PWI15789.1 AraC family transcriptional regulator [Streptomyces sp. Act143]
MSERAHMRWSSTEVEASDALSYWADVVCDTFVGVAVRPGPDAVFEGRIETSVLDGVALTSLTAGPQQVARTRRLIARDDQDVLLANIQLHGRARIEQDRQVAVLAPGSMAFLDSSRPYALDFADGFSQLVVKVPKARLSHRSLNSATAVELSAAGPGKVIADFLIGLGRLHGTGTDPGAATALLPHAVDLLDTALAWAAGTVRPPTSTALTRERVHRFVRRHLTDPGLDAAAVAAACHVSRRTMYRALADDGESLTQLIRRLRVAHAQRLMAADPDQTLTVLARACGFGGEAQLHRAFRSVTGMTPGMYRAQCRHR